MCCCVSICLGLGCSIAHNFFSVSSHSLLGCSISPNSLSWFANGESPLCPSWALFVLPLLPFAAAQCMQSWEQTCPLPNYASWLLPCNPYAWQLLNLLVSHGFLPGWPLCPGFLLLPHHQAGSLSHAVSQTSVTCSHCL